MSDHGKRRRLAGQARTHAAGGHIADLAAPFALHALEPDESAHVARHIQSCAACAKLVAEERRTVALLPFLAASVAPPPQAKATLFARIAETESAAQRPVAAWQPVLPSTVTTPTVPASGQPPVASATARLSPGADKAPGNRRRGRHQPLRSFLPSHGASWPAVARLVAAPLLLVLVGYFGLSLQSQVNHSSNPVSVHRTQPSVMDDFIALGNGSVYAPVDSTGPKIGGDGVHAGHAANGSRLGIFGNINLDSAVPDPTSANIDVGQGVNAGSRDAVGFLSGGGLP